MCYPHSPNMGCPCPTPRFPYGLGVVWALELWHCSSWVSGPVRMLGAWIDPLIRPPFHPPLHYRIIDLIKNSNIIAQCIAYLKIQINLQIKPNKCTYYKNIANPTKNKTNIRN